jgi:hypothetical protein
MLRTKEYAPERYIPAGVTIPSDLDLSLIRLADMTKALPSDTAALPWSPTERLFPAAFVGINKCIDIDPTIVSEFPPAVTKKKIEACVNDLKPMRLSIAQGHAEFTRIVVDPIYFTETCVQGQEIDAGAISYDIATTYLPQVLLAPSQLLLKRVGNYMVRNILSGIRVHC